jgi:polysaccharide pyruvyl transferase WcaK-like protein
MLVRAWPEGRPRILVADAWLANAGDGAIALATERRLRRLAPGAAILHAAYQGDLLAGEYPELTLVPPLAGLLGVTPSIPEMRGRKPDAAARIVAEADAVLSQGGGFAMEHYGPWERLRAWELVVERGLPIAFSAQSVGPFRQRRERAILRHVYERAVLIGLREDSSVANVLDLGAERERVLVTADEAFSLFPADDVRAGSRDGIACVLSAHPWLRADGSLVDPGATIAALADIVSGLVRLGNGERVTLLSTQQGLHGLGRGLEDDAELADRVIALLSPEVARSVQTVPGYLAPTRCADIIASHRGLLSMRMHPAIFGLCRGVPTVLLSEAFKATAMFEMLGLGSTVCAWADRASAVEVLGAPWNGVPDGLARARARCSANDEVVRRLLESTA